MATIATYFTAFWPRSPVKPTFLIISQVYVPDPASVGQHVADAAIEMAFRGYRTVVYTSARGYDDPSMVYPTHESRDGVEVRRLPLSSFGKSSIAVRLLAQWLFLLQAIVLGMFTKQLCGVMVSTSPPFCGVAGAIISKLRRVPLKYWLMDLNPDQMVAMKVLPEQSVLVRIFDAFNRFTLRQAADVVLLDRFMRARVSCKNEISGLTHTMPPWPHDDQLENIAHADNPFRLQHVPADFFCLMYSGNHSPANPLTTLLDAIAAMQKERRLLLLCIGGGAGKQEVEARIAGGADNIRSLPYQPFDKIRFSLSAADVHVVSIGNEVVGIVHPCKVYGAMAVSRPILLLGPSPSHISDLIERHRIGWQIPHGDSVTANKVLREILDTPREILQEMGQRAAKVISGELSKKALLHRFCDALQRDLPAPPHDNTNIADRKLVR
jgi:colanic acid biosynthesis glycosyl transferase WcaI